MALGSLLASSVVVPGAGCGSCPDVDCSSGAPVVFSFLGLDDVATAEICFDEDCAPSAMSTYTNGEVPNVPMTSRDLDGSTVAPGQRFEVSLRAFDGAGNVVATLSETRRRKGEGDCGCGGFGYRWNGERFERW